MIDSEFEKDSSLGDDIFISKYLEQISNDTPDLWSQIDAKADIELKELSRKKHNKMMYRKMIPIAIAAGILLILIPLGILRISNRDINSDKAFDKSSDIQSDDKSSDNADSNYNDAVQSNEIETIPSDIDDDAIYENIQSESAADDATDDAKDYTVEVSGLIIVENVDGKNQYCLRVVSVNSNSSNVQITKDMVIYVTNQQELQQLQNGNNNLENEQVIIKLSDVILESGKVTAVVVK